MFKQFNLQVEIDQKLLNQKANEFAEKALIKELENYYQGYNSPFREALKAELEKKEISIHVELPDALQAINKAIEEEHTKLVDHFINTSFIKQLRDSLQLQDKEVAFSDFLKSIMECNHECNTEYLDEYSVEIIEKDHGLDISIYYHSQRIEVTLSSFDNGKTYEFCRTPYVPSNARWRVRNIEALLLSYALSGTTITCMDVDSFESLFYND